MTSTVHRQSSPNLLPRVLRTVAFASLAIGFSLTTLYAHIVAADAPASEQAGSQAASAANSLVVSEIQTGDCITGVSPPCTGDKKLAHKEFIEIYNQRSDPLDVRGWQIRHLPVSTDQPVTVLATLDGMMAGHDYGLLAYAGFYTDIASAYFTSTSVNGALSESSGRIQIINATGLLIDEVRWSNSTSLAPRAAKVATASRSIQRITDSTAPAILIDTGEDMNDFKISDMPTARGGGYTYIPPVAVEPSPPSTTPAPPTVPPVLTPPTPPMPPMPPTDPMPSPDTYPLPDSPALPAPPNCQGAALSEIMPNSTGTDAGHEFIELHNTTGEEVALTGCSLRTSYNDEEFIFGDVSLQPDEYRAFYDQETGLILPNSAGGTVWLLSASSELQLTAYPADMADDVAWAQADGSWTQTFSATPNAANIRIITQPCPTGQERNPETNRCILIPKPDSPQSGSVPTTPAATATAASTATACKAGQERNPTTNRCRNITNDANEPVPCKSNQIRNPVTNRCAAAVATASANSPTACKPGQERNPETKRCRASSAATVAAKPCPAGQERNPESGRCKKSTAVGSGNVAKVEDVRSTGTADTSRWLLAGVAVIGAVAYGIYEWRQEISRKWQSLFNRNSRQPMVSRA